jgi:hypothetical protein
MTTLTVNGIDFNVEIDTGFGEIEVTDVYGKKVAFAEVDQNMEQGSYTIYDNDGDGEAASPPAKSMTTSQMAMASKPPTGFALFLSVNHKKEEVL